MKAYPSRIFLACALTAASLVLFGCGGSSNSSASSPSSDTGTTPTGTSNVQAITVNAGPAGNYVDGAFTSVTICVPGSSTNCQTIGGILVDTGSSGLRILSSALTISLPAQTDSSGNPIAECAAFADGIAWGPVATADVKMAGEEASSLPIQIVGSSQFSTIPADCASQGQPEDDLASLGANGLLGISPSIQDCGADCAAAGPLSLGTYYTCPSASCTDTTESLARQIQNPVASFSGDNNGTILELPAVSGAEGSVTGSLIFGIGTQSNNGLAGATVFGTDRFGDLTTTYKSTAYPSFLDSGSNAVYFLDTSVTALPVCGNPNFLYCPAAAQTFSVINDALAGTNGASAAASFTVSNADLLLSNPGSTALNGFAGPGPGMFDFGLPFFFGRNVYTAIEGRSTPGGTGPFLAY